MTARELLKKVPPDYYLLFRQKPGKELTHRLNDDGSPDIVIQGLSGKHFTDEVRLDLAYQETAYLVRVFENGNLQLDRIMIGLGKGQGAQELSRADAISAGIYLDPPAFVPPLDMAIEEHAQRPQAERPVEERREGERR